MPVIKHSDGICIVYVDEEADLDMATEIVVNAKTQRPGVCNAIETVLVHRDIHAASFWQRSRRGLAEKKVELRADESAFAALSALHYQPLRRSHAKTIGRRNFSISFSPCGWSIRLTKPSRTSDDLVRITAIASSRATNRRRSVPSRSRFRDCLLERFHPLHRWRRIWLRRGDRDQHRQAARPRTDGSGRADDLQIRDPRHRPGADLSCFGKGDRSQTPGLDHNFVRPERARESVSSSADSRPPPAGKPCAIRVRLTGYFFSISTR